MKCKDHNIRCQIRCFLWFYCSYMGEYPNVLFVKTTQEIMGQEDDEVSHWELSNGPRNKSL